jgi:hypothetical protein
MIDLEKLIPSKFKMAGAPWQWGLIIRKWFEHKGCISLDKVAAYIEEWEAYEKERDEFSGEWITWSSNHRECKAEPGTCPCPPRPKGPDKPVLKDYTTSEEDGCSLSAVLEHPRVGTWGRNLGLVPQFLGFQCRRFKMANRIRTCVDWRRRHKHRIRVSLNLRRIA